MLSAKDAANGAAPQTITSTGSYVLINLPGDRFHHSSSRM